MGAWVFAEIIDGQPTSGALELTTKASTLGDARVFCLGVPSDEGLAALGAHGASTAYVLDAGDALPSAAAATALAALIGEHGGDVVLFGGGNEDRDTAGRLSVKLDRPVVANALDVHVDGGVSVSSEILGGTLGITTSVEGDGPAIVVTRPKAFVAQPTGSGTPAVVTVDAPDAGRSGAAQITARHVEESEGPDLSAAAIVVTGGRGLGGPENFALMDELADLLGGAVGGTRAVVDAGWVPYS